MAQVPATSSGTGTKRSSRPKAADDEQRERWCRGRWGLPSDGLGSSGALVFFWQQADVFWEYVLAVLQALFWPAWMVADHAFAALRS